jgi:hypothetical protein
MNAITMPCAVQIAAHITRHRPPQVEMNVTGKGICNF